MVVIGGTVLTGGKGTIIGTVIGVLLLRVMRNGIVMAGRRARLQHLHRRHHPGHDGAAFLHGNDDSERCSQDDRRTRSHWTISKFYGRVQALESVDLRFSHNEIVGLLGDNGAGKSTLIKIISGVVPLTTGSCTCTARQCRSRTPTTPSRMASRPSTRTRPW